MQCDARHHAPGGGVEAGAAHQTGVGFWHRLTARSRLLSVGIASRGNQRLIDWCGGGGPGRPPRVERFPVATQLRCPRGHLWRPDEFDDEAAPTDPTAAVACPYCGALCTVAAEPLPATKRAPSTAPHRADDHPRAEFPGYEILSELGSGGMGVVYKARQIRTDRVVALKVPGHLDLETRVRFTTEAQAAARVSHPHIVQVYEVGEHQGRPFLALEYVPGGTLADRLTGIPLPPRAAATLAETVARAVGAAHAHGVVHRDLKPSNILLEAPQSSVHSPHSDVDRPRTGDWGLGTPKVADFGLARRLDAD